MTYLFKKRREREQITVHTMIRMYCRAHHGGRVLCNSCSELADYTRIRNIKCVFGDIKPVCNKCRIHCYKPDYRERIKEIMRFSGPRMIISHPLMALDHLIMKLKPHPDVVLVKKKHIHLL
ncbi:MAG: nitrous oxide-stimulated promoter family protein [Chlorobi bacterium]|nr:nitrous oxide-stimulated promoter family protein [Chlorobiota bacterium]